MSVSFKPAISSEKKYDSLAYHLKRVIEKGPLKHTWYYYNELRGLDKKFAKEGEQ